MVRIPGVAGEVTATLTGLIFVAVSINLARILEFPGLPERAAETIVQLLGALIISLVALVPGQSARVVGVELAVGGAILWILQTRPQLHSYKQLRSSKANDRRRPIITIALAQLATVPFVLAGITLALGTLGGLYWLVPGLIFSMIIGVATAWVLLIEILC
jgi:modulator of FtsH protease